MALPNLPINVPPRSQVDGREGFYKNDHEDGAGTISQTHVGSGRGEVPRQGYVPEYAMQVLDPDEV